MKHIRFTKEDIGISGVVPEGWVEVQPGVWLRHDSETDLTHLIQQRVGGLSRDGVMALAISQESLDVPPEHLGMVEGLGLIWECYHGKAGSSDPKEVDFALAQPKNWIYIVVLGTTPGEIGDLH